MNSKDQVNRRNRVGDRGRSIGIKNRQDMNLGGVLLLSLILLLFPINAADAIVRDFRISPEEPVQGDVVKILIEADPCEELPVTISFEDVVAVSNRKYEYDLDDVNVPPIPTNNFTVRAENVKNLRVSVRIFGFWVTKSAKAKDGVATVSQSNVPGGRSYDVRIHGDAAEGASTVTLNMTASTKICTDRNGKYEYSYDTSFIPPGEFTVKVGELAKTVTLHERGNSV